MMHRVIKTEKENGVALARIEKLMEQKATSNVVDELELLATLVGLYEEEVYPTPFLDPVEALRFRMEQQDLKQKDLVQFIGNKSKVSEVLSGKRTLSLGMIRRLHEGLGMSLEVLLGQSESTLGMVAEESAEYRIQGKG